jgi:threonine/homoserine/homoserine lactone efflux protein
VTAAVAGLVVGYVALTAVVSAGVGALVADTPAALTALALVGGGYLMWQGVVTLRRPSTPVDARGRRGRVRLDEAGHRASRYRR